MLSCNFNINSNRGVGVVVRASTSQSVVLGFTSEVESHQKTLQNSIHSFSAWRSAQKKYLWRTSLFVVSIGRTLNRKPPSLRDGAKQSTRCWCNLTED